MLTFYKKYIEYIAKVIKMKYGKKKKVVKIDEPINLINDCILELNKIKKKMYENSEDVNIEYYTSDELDEYVNWGINFKLTDFVR